MHRSFWSNANRDDAGCLVWQGRLTHDGYGKWHSNGAHRAAYQLAFGTIPAGLEIDHKCRNRACIEPSHLEAVTRRENIMRSDNFAAANARKTHCNSGHEFTPENTYVWSGWRLCRACNAAAQKRRKDKIRNSTPMNVEQLARDSAE